MANVLGSLLVLLRADTAEFVGGMTAAGREARRAGKEIEESFSHLGGLVSSALAPFGELGAKLSETFSKVGEAASQARVSAGAMGAVFGGVAAAAVGVGGALVAAGIHAAEVGNKIYEVREKTGLTAQTLEGLMAITKETGGNFDELGDALGKAAANLAKGTLEGSKANQILLAVQGGAKGVAELGLKPMDDRLQIVIKRILDLHDVGQRNLALTALMKNAWQDNLETLDKWANSADGGAEAARKLGLNIDVEKAHAFVLEQRALNAELSALSVTLGSKLVGPMTSMMLLMGNLGEATKGLAADVLELLTLPIPFVGSLAQKIDKAVWDDYRAAIANARKELADSTQGAAAAAQGQIKLTDSTRQHETALERAAKASQDFWQAYNAGLATANEKFPKVISLQDQLMASLHAGQIQMPDKSWRDILPSFRELMEQIHELHAGEIKAGPPGG